jgi:4-hydroxyacetophenone monooxygenase
MDKWQKPIAEADDAQLREALKQAHIPALMATLVHLNGNTDHFDAV